MGKTIAQFVLVLKIFRLLRGRDDEIKALRGE